MFIKSFITYLNSNFDDYGFDNVDPNIVRFYRNEYGANWKIALEHYLYKEKIKNDKKAA